MVNADEPILSLVKDTNSQAKAYKFIKEEILSLRLKPLQRLNAGELAARLGMSRTPVREAFGRLTQDGLVARDAGGGFSVRPITLAEIIDFYRVREALEVEAAREALQRMTPERLRNLSGFMQKAESLLDPAMYAEFVFVSREFHAAIVEASENVAFPFIMAPIVDRVRLVGAMLIRLHAARQHEVFNENMAIFAAFESNDREAVERAVRAHVRKAREHAEQLFSSRFGALVLASS